MNYEKYLLCGCVKNFPLFFPILGQKWVVNGGFRYQNAVVKSFGIKWFWY